MLEQAVQQGHSERRSEEVQTALRVGRSPVQWILANGKTHPALPTSENLNRYVESLCEARTKLAYFFSTLLEVYPKLGIGPILIGVGPQVLLNIISGEHMAIDRLEGQLAVHKQMRPREVYFVADVRLGVISL
jgi:hypothetical protein